MARLAKDIVKAAIQLPENERVLVVEELLASLEPGTDKDVDAAWAAEIEGRAREIKAGTVRPLSWKQVRSRARRQARGET
jgi:putative addiction module component (TIGR02574 family)